MKIAVIGAHGTGKTTLSKGIANLFKFNHIPDVVANAFKLNFPINEDTPPETQFWIISKQIELERNTPISWVMEKSLWDNIIYSEYSIKDKSVLKVLKNIAEKNANYDLVFYCPIEFSIPDDGLRSLDVEFQKVIDKKFRQYLKKQEILFHELKGNEQQRLKKAQDLIKKKQKKLHSLGLNLVRKD